MVLVMIFWAKDYGPMRKSAELSKEGKLYNFSYGEAPGEMDREELLMKPNAKAIGMLFPVIVLVVSATASACAALGTLAGSFTMSLPLAWLVTLVLFVIAINALPKILKG